MPPSQDQDLHVIELTELIEQGKPSVTASAASTGSGEAAQEVLHRLCAGADAERAGEEEGNGAAAVDRLRP